MRSRTVWLAFFAATGIAAGQTPEAAAAATSARGTLLAIGGGLDDDNAPVFERFFELAGGRTGIPFVAVMTAATGDQDPMATGKVAALRTWSPGVRCVVVRRETSTDDTVAAIDAATALFFTGGDQKRIVERYRPKDAETPEWLAMQRLLRRGGVIAGSSAGLAMMGDTMLLGGTSGEALGVKRSAESDALTGPRVGAGMHFLPFAITDSHFFERDRIGRLVAALEATKQRFGLAVGEDGAVEVDLATETLRGVAVSESLVVDVGAMTRDGEARRGSIALRLGRGRQVTMQQLRDAAAPIPKRPAGEPLVEPIVEEGQNRQLASWRLFVRASQDGAWRLDLDGWSVVAWPAGGGRIAFDVEAERR